MTTPGALQSGPKLSSLTLPLWCGGQIYTRAGMLSLRGKHQVSGIRLLLKGLLGPLPSATEVAVP